MFKLLVTAFRASCVGAGVSVTMQELTFGSRNKADEAHDILIANYKAVCGDSKSNVLTKRTVEKLYKAEQTK